MSSSKPSLLAVLTLLLVLSVASATSVRLQPEQMSRKLSDSGTGSASDAHRDSNPGAAGTTLLWVAVALGVAVLAVVAVIAIKPRAHKTAELQEVVISPSAPSLTQQPLSTKKLFVYTAHI